jgi:integrase/recombinase XerD
MGDTLKPVEGGTAARFGVDRFERYITSVRSEGTAAQYARAVQVFLVWLHKQYGTGVLEKAPPDAIASYCAHLAQEYEPASVRLKIASVRRYVKWCRDKGLELHEFQSPEIPKSHVKIKDALRGPALLQYFYAVKTLDEPVRTAALLLPCCGLRVSEMGSLRLDDIQTSSIRMRGARKQVIVIRVRGKGGRERSVPLLDEGRVFLTEYLRGWRKTKSDRKWFFPMATSVNGHLVGRSLRAALQRVRKPLKMTFTPHTMRRTYLTELYRRGVEPVVLAKIAGHANIDTLIRHYLALDDTDVVRAVHKTGGKLMEART